MVGSEVVLSVLAFYIWVGFIVTFGLLKFDIVRGWKALVHVVVWPLTLTLLAALEVLSWVARGGRWNS